MFDPFFFRHEIKKGQVAPMVEHPVEAGAVVVRLHSCPLKYCVNSVRVNTPVFQTGDYSSILYLRTMHFKSFLLGKDLGRVKW